MTRSTKGRRALIPGFALLDLMVSVLVLGLLLVPLAIARNNVILLAERTVLLRKARSLAAVKMGELALIAPSNLAPSSGDFGPDHAGFVWESAVEAVSLRSLVGAALALEGAPEGSALAGGEEPLDAFENFELVKLALSVKFEAPGGEDESAGDDGSLDSGRRRRTLDRVVVTRYYLREKEAE